MANVSIIGGEIAVVPEVVRELDLAGTCFGAVRKAKVIDGRAIRVGDVIIGVPGAGSHSNGLTPARKGLGDSPQTVFDPLPGTKRPWGEDLLRPHPISLRPGFPALPPA